MAESGKASGGARADEGGLPFAAPCNHPDLAAPRRWLKQGWRDLRAAPVQSLVYGMGLMLVTYAVAALSWWLHSFVLMVALLSGAMFVGPVLAIGLYSISCQLEQGRRPVLGYCLREGRRHLGDELLFAAILLVVFLLWARAASVVHIFFPDHAQPDWSELAVFLGVGAVIGALFSAIIFSASAFALPMLMDRKADVVTAVITSVHAVLANKAVMLLWAAMIVTLTLAGFLTGTLFLVLPMIGHATWHAYRETIVADAWPRHD